MTFMKEMADDELRAIFFSYPIQSIFIQCGGSIIRFDPLEAGTVLFKMRLAFSNLFITWIMCWDERTDSRKAKILYSLL